MSRVTPYEFDLPTEPCPLCGMEVGDRCMTRYDGVIMCIYCEEKAIENKDELYEAELRAADEADRLQHEAELKAEIMAESFNEA